MATSTNTAAIDITPRSLVDHGKRARERGRSTMAALTIRSVMPYVEVAISSKAK